MDILQLKIVLADITPKIWRRFLVSDSISFAQLHDLIQIVMGWGDDHLYAFYVKKEQIGLPNPHFDSEQLNAKKVKLKDKLSLKQKFGYVYDFGDNWDHTLIVEKVLDEKEVEQWPTCLAGERACPFEDCGSVPGYYELLELQKNPKHPDYEERIAELLGDDFDFEDFDLEFFDLAEVNQDLRKMAPRRK